MFKVSDTRGDEQSEFVNFKHNFEELWRRFQVLQY